MKKIATSRLTINTRVKPVNTFNARSPARWKKKRKNPPRATRRILLTSRSPVPLRRRPQRRPTAIAGPRVERCRASSSSFSTCKHRKKRRFRYKYSWIVRVRPPPPCVRSRAFINRFIRRALATAGKLSLRSRQPKRNNERNAR